MDSGTGEKTRRIVHCELLSIGGGIGSFALISRLRRAGVDPSDLCVIGPSLSPFDAEAAHFEDVAAPPLGAWYSSDRSSWLGTAAALRFATKTGDVRALLGAVGDPVSAEVLLPRSGDVTASLNHEARRIGWHEIAVQGSATSIRPCAGDGYLVEAQSGRVRFHVRASNVHLALGPGATPMSEKASSFRSRYPDDPRVVQAFEANHDVLQRARDQPSVIAVHGAGQKADYVLNQLLELRETERLELQVVQIQDARSSRDDDASVRPLWFERRLLRAAGSGSCVRMTGEINELRPDGNQLRVEVETFAGALPLRVDSFIDALGVPSAVGSRPLIADLAEAMGVQAKALDRLAVDESCAFAPFSHGSGKCYVSGSMAERRMPTAPDDVLSHQIAARCIAEDLTRSGIGERVGLAQSLAGWVDWVRAVEPG